VIGDDVDDDTGIGAVVLLLSPSGIGRAADLMEAGRPATKGAAVVIAPVVVGDATPSFLVGVGAGPTFCCSLDPELLMPLAPPFDGRTTTPATAGLVLTMLAGGNVGGIPLGGDGVAEESSTE
jgi:hypothetical protein